MTDNSTKLLEYQNQYWKDNPLMFLKLLELVNYDSPYFPVSKLTQSNSYKDLFKWVNIATEWMKVYDSKKPVVLQIHFIMTGISEPPLCANSNCPNYGNIMQNIMPKVNKDNLIHNNSRWYIQKYCSPNCQRVSDEVKLHRKEYCMNNFGCSCTSQIPSSRKKTSNTLKKLWKNQEFVEQKKQTCMAHFGVDHQFKSPIIQEKCRKTTYDNFGVENYFQSQEFKDLMSDPVLNQIRMDKQFATRKANGTLVTSKSENQGLLLLQEIFGLDDVERSYKSQLYPFHCDYYIKSLDLYIELNEHWTHGKHKFDPNSKEDLGKVKSWKENGSKYYDNAIYVWTDLDPRKMKAASDNNLNYIVFWDVSELEQWCQSKKMQMLNKT